MFLLKLTENVKAEEALKESEELLLKIAENYPNSYLSIIDKDFRVGFTSGKEFKIQNLNPSDFVGLQAEMIFGDQWKNIKPYFEETFAGKEQSFDEAVNTANFKLVKEEDFILFVDVRRARFSGIKPLPQRIKTADGWEIVEEPEVAARENIVPSNIIEEGNTGTTESSQFTKQKLWERKLLDLSLRNNLLNSF